MRFPALPTPDDVVKLFLGIALGPGVAAWFAFLIWAVYSWYDIIRKAAEAARTGVGSVRSWIARIGRSAPHVVILALLASILLLLAQAFWVLFSFIVGNVISAAVGVNYPLHTLMVRAGNTVPSVPTWSQFESDLRLDAISGGYVALSILAVIRTYWRARDTEEVRSIGRLFTFPAYFYGFLGLLGGVLSVIFNIGNYFVHAGSYVSSSVVAFLLCLGVLGTLYLLACRLLAWAPRAVADMWSGRNAA
jgi:hypothetical protein